MATQLSNTAITAFKTAATQSGFLKKLFSQGIDGVPPASLITEFRTLLKIAGVTLPEGVAVPLDVMQMILAGGAIVNDIQLGATALEVVGDVSNVASGVANLLADLGVGGDAMKQLADFASLGTSLVLAIGSYGGNVFADIGVVISTIAVVGDLKRDFFGNHDSAVADAKSKLAQALQNAAQAFAAPQVQYASGQVQAFHNGTINYFDLVGNIALKSPIELPQFFPQLACYFPTWQTITISATATGESGGLFGNQTDTESASYQFQELLATKAQVEAVLFNYFIGAPAQAFKSFFNVSQGASLEALSIISMILSGGASGAISLTSDFDILGACQVLGVTPGILGDDWLFKGLDKNELNSPVWAQVLPYPPLTISYVPFAGSGVSVNGVPYLTPTEQKAQDDKNSLVQFQLYLQHLDSIGDIDSLMKIPEAVALLKKWATFTPDKVLGQGQNPFLAFDSTLGPPINPIPAGAALDISDYWKCLSVTKQMEASNLFSDKASILADFGSIDELTARMKAVQAWVVAKILNKGAQAGIASAFGTSPDNLGSRITKNGTKVFYKKRG